MNDKHNVPLSEVATELQIPFEDLQRAIDAIRERRGLKPGEHLRIEVPSDRITPATYLQKQSNRA